MRFTRFSIAGLLGAAGLCAFGLACLLQASTPWAGATYSLTLGFLTVALVGVACRTGERRAFWVGFAICGWIYMMLATGPWIRNLVGDRLATTRLLDWAYPRLIPAERQTWIYSSRVHIFEVQGQILGEMPTTWVLNQGGERVDVWVNKKEEEAATLLIDDIHVAGAATSGTMLTGVVLHADSNQLARLKRAQAAGMTFILKHHIHSPFAPLWSTPPITDDDFRDVGHSWFGLLWAWIGGWVGRYFYATRDRGP
jgi:hypothetical protein